MSQANPFDQFDGHAFGTSSPGVLTGPPPVPKDPPAPKTTWRTVTGKDAAARNLDPNKVYQVSSEGEIKDVPNDKGNTPVNEAALKSLNFDEVLTAIGNARSNTSGWSTGWGGDIFRNVGGTQAKNLEGDLSTIGSHLTVDKLQDMKAQSATGASGMGALSEKEGALLRDSVAGLDPSQSEDKIRASLDAIELHYRRLKAIQDGQNPDDPSVMRKYGYLDQAATEQYHNMLGKGASTDDILGWLKTVGLAADRGNIDRAVRFHQDNPDVPVREFPFRTLHNTGQQAAPQPAATPQPSMQADPEVDALMKKYGV